MKIVENSFGLIFPGQGSQSVGMGHSFYEAYPHLVSTFSEANGVTGRNITELMFNGPTEQLNDTLNTQPALYTHSMVAFDIFQRQFPNSQPAYVAGHSLGQLSATVASGALSLLDGMKLVDLRARLMTKAGEREPGSMAAVLGLDIPTLEGVCAEVSTDGEVVIVANDNCPGQVVLSGHKGAIDRACAAAKSAGAKRALPLAVSIAAHSPLMTSIQEEWNAAIDSFTFVDPRVPIVGNTIAGPLTTAGEVRSDLKKQMQSRVRWTESIQWLSAQGVKNYFEIGNGSVLAGLVKRVDTEAVVSPFGNVDDINKLNGGE